MISVFKASSDGNLPLLKLLKENGEDIYIKDKDGNNALLKTCYGTGDIDTIKWLLHQGFSPEYKDKGGYNAFLLAAEFGKLSVLKFLKEINVDIKVTGIHGQNALHTACIGKGDINTIKWLLDQGFSAENKTYEGYNAFLLAAEFGNLPVLEFLKEINTDIKATGPDGQNALHRACVGKGDTETIKWLLRQDFSPEDKNNRGCNAFLLAAEYGKLSVLKFLKDIHADMKVTGIHGQNALHTACVGKGDINTIKWLLDQGFSPEDKTYQGYNAFLLAAEFGNLSALKLLKRINADIKFTAPDGQNALHRACAGKGDIDTIKWLLQQDLLPQGKQDTRYNAFLLAAEYGNLPVLKFLKEMNVDTRVTSLAGGNALHRACIGSGDVNTIKWLLKQGFSIETPNSDGKTAFYLAVMRGHTQLVRFFMHLNANILNKRSENW